MGLQNRKILGKLQLDPNLTLEKTTNLVRQRETVRQQQNILVGKFNSTPVHVDGIAKGKSRRRRGNFKEKSQDKSKDWETFQQLQREKSWSKVPRCFGNLHPQKTPPARFSRCNKCSKTSYWVQACKSSQPGKLFEVVEEESFLLGEIVDVSEVQSNSTKSLWTATILVETS